MSDEDEELQDELQEEHDSTEVREENEKDQHAQLSKAMISEGLSVLSRTGSGLGHAFIRLELKNKALSDITAISCYVHIRFLDLSNNHITDLSPLATLNHLLWLKVDSNAVACFKGQPFAALALLQWLSMAANCLTDVDDLVGPALESLNLTENSIQQLKGFHSGCFMNLVTLELRGNQLDSTDGINLPNLRKLYLAQNVISRLEGLETLKRLTVLHLRDNQLKSLDGLSSSMKCLQYLNVRGNVIPDAKALKSLKLVSQTLKVLVLSKNPLVETSDHRLSVLMMVPKLERIDKDNVSPDERSEARRANRELKEEEIPEP